MKRSAWTTRFGFYFVAIGSAFGLGNLWRFPYVVANNGGGAFVLLYLLLVFLVGVPLLIGELMLGKSSGKSVVASLDSLRTRQGFWSHWWVSALGKLSVISCLIVLAYFAVISGWVLNYFVQFCWGQFTSEDIDPVMLLSQLRANGWLQVGLTVAHLGVVTIIVGRDVEEGIERWVGYMIPAFGVLLIALAFKALSFETSFEALRFLFYPDFSKLNVTSLGQALGHVCFTLSIGLGSMVTFGSYFREKVYVPLVGFRVATLDALISLFAGLLIFPLALAAGSVRSGPELLFQSVPVLFTRIPGGYLYGILFFLCLYLAALGASIGLLECIVANFIDTRKWRRAHAAMVSGGTCLLIALVPALSSSALRDFKWGDRGLLELLDAALINWLLPIVALGVSQVISYRLDDQTKRSEFFKDDSPPPLKLYSHWVFVFRWVVPVIIVLALSLQVLGFLTI